MTLKVPRAFVLNTGHPKLDIVYTIQKKADEIDEKRQKAKVNMLHLSVKL